MNVEAINQQRQAHDIIDVMTSQLLLRRCHSAGGTSRVPEDTSLPRQPCPVCPWQGCAAFEAVDVMELCCNKEAIDRSFEQSERRIDHRAWRREEEEGLVCCRVGIEVGAFW